MAALKDDTLHQIFARARDRCKSWPLSAVQFSVQTGWAREYADIFAGRFDRVLDEAEILDSVLNRGRAILAGRGGDGKTWLLRRLYIQILDRGDLPVLLDLKNWTGADYEEWKLWTSNDVTDAADFLIRKFSGLEFGAIDLDRLPPAVRKILLVDGLNEITSVVGIQVLQVLDELVRDQINLSVLVADRLIRRDLPNFTRWSIGNTLPLSKDQVRKHLGPDVKVDEILTCPFFLDAALRFHVKDHRRPQASERFLLLHGGVAKKDLDRLALAAFVSYCRTRSRVFNRGEFVQFAGEAATQALELSNTLVSRADGTSSFVHHLLHDYLAARHFAGLAPESWTPEALAVLSFDSSSFDAVELVFEQLDGQRADLFLRQLYDWNLYAAGYALAQASDVDTYAGAEVRTMIFAMLAGKRFDLILATRQRADDALSLMQLADAKPFREASSLQAVFAAVNAVQSDEVWFNEWKELFRTGPDSILKVETLASILSADSISGWTVSNVVKRSRFEGDAPEILTRWLRNEVNATVRWRIAHSLGAYPTPIALEALLVLLDRDPDVYVRYGAVRSVIELGAWADAILRNKVAESIEVRAEIISEQPKILGELRTCLLIDPNKADSAWLEFVRKIVRSMFLANDSTKERDLWRQCLNKAEELYPSNNGNQQPNGPSPRRLHG